MLSLCTLKSGIFPHYICEFTDNLRCLAQVLSENKPLSSSGLSESDIKRFQPYIDTFGLEYCLSMPATIENCGYHLMNREMCDDAGVGYITPNTTDAYMYHEWY